MDLFKKPVPGTVTVMKKSPGERNVKVFLKKHPEKAKEIEAKIREEAFKKPLPIIQPVIDEV